MTTSSDIRVALREKYRQPEWCIFFEVGNGTGVYARRHADALAVNMYPSRGTPILGFEIKVSRSDLNRELVNPDKAESVGKYCDEWWLVVPAGLINESDDIPRPWGILELKEGKLLIAKKADPLQPQPLSKNFLISILRAAGKFDEQTLQKVRSDAIAKAKAQWEGYFKQENAHLNKELQSLRAGLAQLESAIGKKITTYTNWDDLILKFKLAENYQRLFGRFGTLRSLRQDALEIIKQTDFLDLEEDRDGTNS